MDFQTFRLKSKDYPVFKYVNILKWFPNDNELTIKQNLKSWVKKGLLERIIKGVYKLKETNLEDEFLLASYFDENSYISLESGLSFYGMIPEYPYTITSVTTRKTKKFITKFGVFSYRKIKNELFFGFKIVTGNNYLYKIATPEKALFDFIYLHQDEIKNTSYFEEMRLTINKNFAVKKFFSFLSSLKNNVIISLVRSYVSPQ